MFLIEELDDREFLAELTRRTCRALKPAKLDYKKEYKDLYAPKTKPALIQVPEMIFIMVDGKGDPNTSKAYKDAMEILYGLSYSIKMSKMSGNAPEGYFEYVVPPLEGFCAQVMHKGPYDAEPETICRLEQFIEASGFVSDIGEERQHHEIYLSDPRRTAPERLKTVIRHPIKVCDL